MRTTTVALALAGMLALGSCGEATGSGSEPGPSPSAVTSRTTPTPTTKPSADTAAYSLVEIVSAPRTSGTPVGEVNVLTPRAEGRGFLRSLTPDLRAEVDRIESVADLADDQVLVAAVIAVGCDVPPDVVVATQPLRITGAKVASPLDNCLVEHTSVAVVLVEESLLG